MKLDASLLPKDAVAIIGTACRFPGGIKSANDLWDFTQADGDGIVPIPRERWSRELETDVDKNVPGVSYVDQGGFLDKSEICDFDASFFDISPVEAEKLDPQQRLLLTVAWEAFENAGLTRALIQGSDTAVFTGCFTVDNMLVQDKNLESASTMSAFSITQTMTSARLAHAFDLKAPCLTIDTACSSSLVAVNLAVKALLNDECSMALAGGVNAIHSKEMMVWMSKGGFLAPDGQCKTFTDLADGYARAEGCGVIVLRRLEDAISHGDQILAVIRGTGINQDGRTAGIASPSQDAQRNLIIKTLDRADIAPSDVVFVEAHGTGTNVGDKIEIGAIADTYGKNRNGQEPVAVASVKSNIGHCEGAAGIAGIIRAVMAVKKHAIPKHSILNGRLSSNLQIGSQHGVQVLADARPICEALKKFSVAVNSFGYGGTNCHVLLSPSPEESHLADNPNASSQIPKRIADRTDRPPFLIPVSARSEEALQSYAKELLAFIRQSSPSDADVGQSPFFSRLCHSLAHHRSHFEHRAVIRAASLDQFIQGLEQLADTGSRTVQHATVGQTQRGSKDSCIFVFTGMGPQWWAMGAQLYETNPVFRSGVDEANEAYVAAGGDSIVAKMFKPSAAESEMAHNNVAQPANFILQIGLMRVLEHRVASPSAIIGHSVGEVTAALVGFLFKMQRCMVVHARATLQQRMAGRGGMATVGVSAKELAKYLEQTDLQDKVDIAAYNSASMVTVAGDSDSLATLQEAISSDVFFAKMRVEVPYHSRHMEAENIEND